MAKFNLDKVEEIAKPRSEQAIRRAEERRAKRKKHGAQTIDNQGEEC